MDRANCYNDPRYTDDQLPLSTKLILASRCQGCPVFAECEAGIKGDKWWTIRAGRINGGRVRNRNACGVPGCSDLAEQKVAGRPGPLPKYCTRHANLSYSILRNLLRTPANETTIELSEQVVPVPRDKD